tara:strand:- start:285 stop:419 length:135 start_codon:yes stop_codon:yes gene_type:complete
MFHSEWTAPLGLSAPVWGVLSLLGYLFFLNLATKKDKGQWDKGE